MKPLGGKTPPLPPAPKSGPMPYGIQRKGYGGMETRNKPTSAGSGGKVAGN